MAEVKWIKITTDMFEDEKIDFIQSLPEGDSLLVIWVRLLTMAGKCNANGYIFLTENIPYTEESLAYKFKKSLNVVKLALQTFQKLKMIQIGDRGIELLNWSKYQNLEGLDKLKQREYERVKKRKQREKAKELQAPAKEELASSGDVPNNVPGTNEGTYQGQSTGTPSYIRDREIDKEIDIEIEDRLIDRRKDLDKINQAYFNTFYRQISGSYMQKILDILNKGDYTNLILYALEKTKQRIDEQKKEKGFNYTLSILESWINKGFKTVSDVKNNEEKKAAGSEQTPMYEPFQYD